MIYVSLYLLGCILTYSLLYYMITEEAKKSLWLFSLVWIYSVPKTIYALFKRNKKRKRARKILRKYKKSRREENVD